MQYIGEHGIVRSRDVEAIGLVMSFALIWRRCDWTVTNVKQSVAEPRGPEQPGITPQKSTAGVDWCGSNRRFNASGF